MKPHIHLDSNADYARVVTCGSPERAAYFSTFLKDPKPVAKNREYHSYVGTYEGKKILIMSHGVGSAGAAICFQELIDVGAKAIIRIGTAGGLYEKTKVGDIVVATSAVRKDGVSALMIPVAYPAVADLELSTGLILTLRAQGWKGRAGPIVTTDLFYPGKIDDELKLYSESGVHAVEMECSTLFVIGSLRGVKTGGMLVLDGSPLKWDEGVYNPDPEGLKASMNLCLKSALEVLKDIP